jgi:hypothetical protein
MTVNVTIGMAPCAIAGAMAARSAGELMTLYVRGAVTKLS